MRKQHEKPNYNADGQKQCTRCKQYKDLSGFHKYSKSPDGYKHFCKICVKEYDLTEHDAKRVFPRKINEFGQIHCRNCGGYFEESQMKESKSGSYKGLTYCINCSPLLSRIRNIKSYGITIEQYHQMLEDQKYACKICGLEEKTFRKRLSIDHDHSCCSGIKSCGKCIRGIICSSCNMALGNVKDNIQILQKMIDYLKA